MGTFFRIIAHNNPSNRIIQSETKTDSDAIADIVTRAYEAMGFSVVIEREP